MTKTGKTLSALVLAFSTVLALPVNAGWFGDDEPLVVTVDTAYIDVYSGPGRGYPIFHALEKGERITLLKSRTQWIKVLTDKGTEGWIKRDAMLATIDATGTTPDFADSSRADAVDGSFELGAGFGGFGGADSTTLTLGYRFTRNLTIEARYAQQAGRFSDSEIIAGGITHQPFPDWWVSPYLGMGAGSIKIHPSATLVDTEDREDSVLQASVGAYVYLSRRFFLRLDYTNHYLLTTRENNDEVNEWRVGFNVFF
ncbi:SH3 domain-containing protein [Gilvimarinus sp. SDUM040013]|uniref:SH3 domain-containing protein n=1 Tax=Gilvimarinus gilvus TaxID=3058038 RepID=A0ABU4RZH7_9GAMM|nr:SH3 domain-containing protein [Gilvimarinus sp. SDUM040013]MDO3384681.1 SH3 domain-containing protein [Gilvimarinus sp. SDUM040013]MDX6850267.1 SH3 domain-containing protein [Gilvimarinus sp. SDUM040013]